MAPGCTGAEGGQTQGREWVWEQVRQCAQEEVLEWPDEDQVLESLGGKEESKSCVQDNEAWAGQSSGARRRNSSL